MSVFVLYPVFNMVQCLCPPGFTAEDSDSRDECRELPFSGEQNEAHDSLSGAGEGNLPEDHWTHALMPSPWRPDRCGDDPDQNRTQRESQNCSQEALMATRGLAAPGRHTGRHWSEQLETALAEGCWAQQQLLYCCTIVAEFCKCVMSGREMRRLYGKYLRDVWWEEVSVILANRLFPRCIKAAVVSHLFHCQFEGEIKMHNISLPVQIVFW